MAGRLTCTAGKVLPPDACLLTCLSVCQCGLHRLPQADLLTSREAESVLRASAVQKEAALLELVFSRQQQEDELFVKVNV
jgi:hypothetical protein